MATCRKCGKVLLEGEKKCERCINKGKEARNKILKGAALGIGVLGLGGKKLGSTLIKFMPKK